MRTFRVILKVNPKEEYKQGSIYTLAHRYGSEDEGEIRHATVQEVPENISWLKEGDIVWFTQQARQQQGVDSKGVKPCVIWEQDEGELWALTESWAKQTILGIQRGDVLTSSPRYLACLPIELKEETVLDIDVDATVKEAEIRAICIEDKEGYKDGDIIHFEANYDYPAKTMQSKWVEREGKRVLFIKKRHIFGKERNGKFYANKHWVILKALDEGDLFQKNSFGLFLPRTGIEEEKGDAKVVYSRSDELSRGDKVKHPKRSYRALEVKNERLYAMIENEIWFKYA